MNTQKEISQASDRLDTGSDDHQDPMRDPHKEKWLQEYASRILMVWTHWQTPLGVAQVYTDKIEKDLARFYDDPLKRLFIEATY